MVDKKIGFHKKIMGAVCRHCPICRYGRKNPESFIGKILHARIHADHCPLWKAEKEIYGEKQQTQ
ncbi:MAG: hypothetical protein JRI77_03635 [Deltaproteobacteria bacterium]|nr:hypothetical protein [Deltaproteobacteria bacterium]